MNPTTFRGQYRIQSNRLQYYDYSLQGAYFITICTHNRLEIFGNVMEGKMTLNELGHIAENEWQRTSIVRPNITIDEFVVMPNHIHGIVVIDYKIDRGGTNCVKTNVGGVETNWGGVETNCNSSLRSYQRHDLPQQPRPHGTSQTIGSIVRGFKIGVTKYARENLGIHDVWQRNYHDHIIRNEEDLDRIRTYILSNPMNWSMDRNGQCRAKTPQQEKVAFILPTLSV